MNKMLITLALLISFGLCAVVIHATGTVDDSKAQKHNQYHAGPPTPPY